MDREKEIALALSSCPASVANMAAVYVLEKSGYVKVGRVKKGSLLLSARSTQQAKIHSAWMPRVHATFLRAI